MKPTTCQQANFKSRLFYLIYALATFSLLYPLTNLYADKLNQITPLPTVAGFNPIDIPFIDWMILPYACSLPLFIASFFIMRSYSQLIRLTHRLLLVTLLGCLCFYWLPLSFLSTNDHTTALLNNTILQATNNDCSNDSYWINGYQFVVAQLEYKSAYQCAYQLLHTVDKPYNQLPSLHVSYALLLMVTIWHSLNSIINKVALATLSLLIILSTLFTWQHHLLDVISGIFMAGIVWLIDQYLDKNHQDITKSSIIKYLVVGVSGFLVIQILPVVFSVSLWTPLSSNLWNQLWSPLLKIIGYYWLLSFVVLAMAYHWHKPSLFSKINGRHSVSSYLLFAPVIIIYRLMWWLANKMDVLQIPTEQTIIKINHVLNNDLNTNSNNNLDILATAKLTSSAVQDMEPILKNYQHIIYLDVGCEINASFAMLSKHHANSHLSNYHYLHTPMLDMTAWNRQEYDTIVHYCQQLTDIIMAISLATSHDNLSNKSHDAIEKPAHKPILIISQCVMGWSRSVTMLACIMAYFGHSPKEIRHYLLTHYPKSHLDGILDDELLQCLSQHLSQEKTKIIQRNN